MINIKPNNIYVMSANDLLQQLADESVDMQFFDPPYGIGYKAGTSTRNDKSKERAFSSQTFDDVADTSFLVDAYRVLTQGGACYLCTQWNVIHVWQNALEQAGYDVHMCIIWDKALHGAGNLSYYGCQTEMILFATKGKHQLNWNKRESNIWYVPRIDVINIDGNFDNPTQKPTTLVKRAIHRSSKRGDVILDCHIGTGTTMVAAKQMERQYIGCDIEQSQVDIARSRLSQPVTLQMFA